MVDPTKDIASVFISDVHLGNPFSDTRALLAFLRVIKDRHPETLYIVGDFLDGWRLSRSWHWTDDCSLIIRRLIGFVKRGTKVIYLPGNHDDFLRHWFLDFHDMNLGSILICDEAVHQGLDGRRYLVIHGDAFDTVIRCALRYTPWLCTLGDIGYEFMIRVNRLWNWGRARLGLSYWSISCAMKNSMKKASAYIGGFETILANYAREKNCQGVICGHIHSPCDRMIGDVRYVNTGDWMETCSAVVEYQDGMMEVIYFHETDLADAKDETDESGKHGYSQVS